MFIYSPIPVLTPASLDFGAVPFDPVVNPCPLGVDESELALPRRGGTGVPDQGCQMAKFDPFLSFDCTRVEGVGVQSKDGIKFCSEA